MIICMTNTESCGLMVNKSGLTPYPTAIENVIRKGNESSDTSR